MKTLLLLLALPTAAFAQGSLTTDFPIDAKPLEPEVLRLRVLGKSFSFKPASGIETRFEYKDNGYVFVNAGAGSDSGKWRVEGSSLCVDLRRFQAGCSEARLMGDVLYIKRISNGEIVALTPR